MIGGAPGCAEDPATDTEIGVASLASRGEPCRTEVRTGGLVVAPAVVTPADGNGVFDLAELGFSVEVDPGRGSCMLDRQRFNFYVAWSVEIVDVSGRAVRQFDGREYLDLEGCTGPVLAVPVTQEWAGETDRGIAPPGPYRVVVRSRLEMQRRPDGRFVTVRRAPVIEAALEVAGSPTAEELLLVEADGLKAGMVDASGTDPDAMPYDEVVAPTCSLSGSGGTGQRNCHVRNAAGTPVAVGAEALDWFEALVARQTVLRGRSGGFGGYVDLVRAGVTPRTRVSSTTDSLYRQMTDSSPVWRDAAELFLAFDPVVRQGRPGVFLDRLDDRTSRRGRGEARLAFRAAPVTARGTLDHGWDSDWFVLRASPGVAGRQYTIRARPEDPRTTDTVLEVWSHGGTSGGWRRIARDDGVERDVISVTLDPSPAEVTLYVRVATPRAAAGIDGLLFPYRFEDGRAGDYQLVVYPSTDDYPEPSAGSACPLPAHRGRTEGRLRTGDRDGFAIDLPGGGSTALTVKTPGVRSGGRLFVRAEDETSWREVTRSPPTLLRDCGPECFETVLDNRVATGRRFFAMLDGDDLPARTRLTYLVSTAGRPGTLDTCPVDSDDATADRTCKINGLAAGEASYRAGALLDAADADSYWVQALAGESIQLTATGVPGAADAVEFTVHPEGTDGRLCADRTIIAPDGRAESRSASIAEGVAVPAWDRSGGATLSFVVPAQHVAPPGAIGWYRVRITPVAGRASFPQQYVLVVHRGPESDDFPEVE